MTFDFSKLTIGDVKKLSSDMTNGDLIEFLDKVTVGGVLHMPFAELSAIVPAVLAEYSIWMASFSQDESALADMLKDVKGL